MLVKRLLFQHSRSVGKDNTFWDSFLNLICPKIGVVRIDEYLSMMNWIVEITLDGFEGFQASLTDLKTLVKEVTTAASQTGCHQFYDRRDHVHIAQRVIQVVNEPPAERRCYCFN